MAAIIIPIGLHFQAKQEAKSPEELAKEASEAVEEAAKWSQPSDWLAHFLDMFQYLYIIGAPGIFVSAPAPSLDTC